MTIEEAKKELVKFVELKTTMRPTFVSVLLEAEPVRHGHWIYNEGETKEDGGYCSECQHDTPMFRTDWNKWEYCETEYCPNCGAKMDEVEE